MSFVYQPTQEQPRLIHHDDQILVVEKPAGLLSVPGRGEDRADCLINRLRGAFPTVLLVHRLDMDTSGIMVFGLTPHAQKHLGQQFERRQVKKAYVARVWGRLEGKEGRVDLPLIVDWPNRPRQKVDHAEGRPAQTDWRVIRASDAETRVRLYPLTGRSHQLRVHMASLGHPILGDPLYAEGPAADHPRLMLHAESLRLRHPDSNATMSFSAPPLF
ncbi:RluA family pseudouridine synthase [Paracoccus chinensis]|uniref:Pseudouridine synthase n=1 Tax=Paracoccus chinensis TaxID=525640 RepID=A0A1G9KE67_9RHOB|nr:RluA family pseudouridine synthase [Paracoccus chinensis]SDL48017.1 tRNA pseudouridine32 synthase / 23S rRNA pseudouridine746 synthase [Paracoccus chinensis]